MPSSLGPEVAGAGVVGAREDPADPEDPDDEELPPLEELPKGKGIGIVGAPPVKEAAMPATAPTPAAVP
eukprot:12882165-Prorocentrum_lima.AAC.1